MSHLIHYSISKFTLFLDFQCLFSVNCIKILVYPNIMLLQGNRILFSLRSKFIFESLKCSIIRVFLKWMRILENSNVFIWLDVIAIKQLFKWLKITRSGMRWNLRSMLGQCFLTGMLRCFGGLFLLII